MKVSNLLTLSLLFFGTNVLVGQNADALIGKWQDRSHKNQQVEIYKKEGKYFGKAINDPSQLVFKDLTWDINSKTYKGTLINPANGEELLVEIELSDPDNFKFSMGIFIFKKTFRFNRI